MEKKLLETINHIRKQADPGISVKVAYVINHAHVLTVEKGKKLDYHLNSRGEIVDITEVKIFPNYYGVDSLT